MDNLHPTFAAILAPIAPPQDTDRRPALPGFIVRRCFADGAKTARQTVVAAVKAELAWSVADWRRLNPHFHGWNGEAEGMAAGYRLPHEAAAARVLNAWGHLHPVEWRVRAIIKMLRAGCHHPEAVREDLRWYLTERQRLAKAFYAAVREYQRLRSTLKEAV